VAQRGTSRLRSCQVPSGGRGLPANAPVWQPAPAAVLPWRPAAAGAGKIGCCMGGGGGGGGGRGRGGWTSRAGVRAAQGRGAVAQVVRMAPLDVGNGVAAQEQRPLPGIETFDRLDIQAEAAQLQ